MNRPINTIGLSNFKLDSEDEEAVFWVTIITEGSKEEPNYIEFYKEWLSERGLLHKNIRCLNKINEECGTNSHPLSRYELLKSILQQKDPNYSAYSNDAWVVCDRDERSFKEDQYDLLMEKCKLDKINLVVSNPAFQLWILFHFDSWIREQYYNDDYNNLDRLSFIEKRIRTCLKLVPASKIGYSHGNMPLSLFQILCTRIDGSIQNSKKYTTDVKSLKSELGTNFADLIEAIRN